ncbi:class I SAM-dependent methyltransferase [Streptomyces sp. NPDC093510]|uniref:class I SAM-dependent methyltransferase n=1 Tax=Streptomyces sp. NPDC093510 TaxID=3155199 RepID=UPI0034462F97
MADSYAGLARYYDLIMTSGYYDYAALAQELLAHLGDRRRLLELGVGTGLVCEKLLEHGPPDLRITGIDHTASMLAQAHERLGGRVRLIEGDIVETRPAPDFDAAYSVGGIWYGIQDEGRFWLGSHLTEEDEDIRGLDNLAAALPPGGQLLLALQDPHHPYRRTLPGGLVYAQEIRTRGNGRFVKEYSVLRADRTLARQRSPFRLRPQPEADRLLERCGFVLADHDPGGRVRRYTRS